MKGIRSRLGEVVHLRDRITALIDCKGIGIDRRLLHRIQADHKIGRKADVQPQPRIVRVIAVQNVAVRSGGQPVELDIAVSARRLRIVRRARGVHQRTLRKLRYIGKVLTWVGEVLDRLRFQGCRRVRIIQTEQSLLRGDFYLLRGGDDLQCEIQSHRPSHAHRRRLRYGTSKTRRGNRDAIRSRIYLREDVPSARVRRSHTDCLRIDFRRGDGRPGNGRAARIGHAPGKGARGAALRG